VRGEKTLTPTERRVQWIEKRKTRDWTKCENLYGRLYIPAWGLTFSSFNCGGIGGPLGDIFPAWVRDAERGPGAKVLCKKETNEDKKG